VFLAAVAAPALRALPAQERGAAMARIGRRFRVVGWGALLLLIATGLHTMARLGLLSAHVLTGTPVGRLLLGKLVLVAGILALTAAHDLLLRAGGAQVPAKRRTALGLARASGVLTVVVPVVGVLLAHG
jgi:putative copper export protein